MLINLLFVQLAPFLYVLFCYIDYVRNKESYENYPEIENKLPLVTKNVFLYMPLTHYLVFSLFPHEVVFKTGFKEMAFLVLELIFSDIYFYSLHRLCHSNKYLYRNIHKTHHEIKETLGVFAFYCHPLEMVVVNMGNVYISHIIFRHSYFHNGVMALLGFSSGILGAHSGNNNGGYHQLHHLHRKCNYGLEMFMDRLMGTEKMPE